MVWFAIKTTLRFIFWTALGHEIGKKLGDNDSTRMKYRLKTAERLRSRGEHEADSSYAARMRTLDQWVGDV